MDGLKPVNSATPRAAYRPADVAEMLGMSVDKVYELVRSGDIPHRRLGRKIVIPAKRFFEWLNAPETQA